MICKFCGEEFEPNSRGRKSDHCGKIECIKKKRSEWVKNYRAKSKNANLTEQPIKPLEEQEKKHTIIYSKNKDMTNINNDSMGDILQIARELGSLRFQLVELIQKESEKISNGNKMDQDFLHKIEFLDELTDNEAIDLIVNEKKSRESRRIAKNRYFLLSELLNGILIKNPNKFCVQIIQNSKNLKYAPRVVQELKQDANLYVQIGDDKKEND